MKITECQIHRVKSDKSSLVAFANITFDDEFVVKGLKVVDGKNGLFVAMPSSRGEDGKYYDDAFPLTKECREYITDFVLSSYEDSEPPKKARKR